MCFYDLIWCYYISQPGAIYFFFIFPVFANLWSMLLLVTQCDSISFMYILPYTSTIRIKTLWQDRSEILMKVVLKLVHYFLKYSQMYLNMHIATK